MKKQPTQTAKQQFVNKFCKWAITTKQKRALAKKNKTGIKPINYHALHKMQ
jgi:hypothetical protein